MKKLFILFVCLFALMAINTSAQAAENLKAQGYYYEALSDVNAVYAFFPNTDYENVIELVTKSKEALKGTNPELQLLLVKSYSALGLWDDARRELTNYVLLSNGTFRSVNFDDNVTKLSSNDKEYLAKQSIVINSNIELLRNHEIDLGWLITSIIIICVVFLIFIALGRFYIYIKRRESKQPN